MKIELYLQGKRVEINQDIDFVLNKQFTELTDLTTIIVDYSKTIKVPMTPHNNELFNYVYRLERQFMGTPLEAITYDPSQKIDMYMTFNDSKVMDGYALLNSVNLKDKTYEINLYGQLGKIFSDLKNRTLGGSPGYHTPSNGWSKRVRMHTNTIYNSFYHSNHSTAWYSSNWWDFFGFAPQMIGDTDIIETDCYEKYNPGTDADRIKKFEDEINTTRGISYADVYLNNGGFDLNGYLEQRTYMTRPYVYVDKIIQMVQNEINLGDYDGYKMNLDSDWFNNNNPYFKNMVFFPGNETPVAQGENKTGYIVWDNTEMTFNPRQVFMPSVLSNTLDEYTYSVDRNTATITASGGNTQDAVLTLNCDGIQVRDKISGISQQQGWNVDRVRWGFYRANGNYSYTVPIRYISISDGNNNTIYKLYLCDDTITIYQQHSRGINNIPVSGIWNRIRNNSSLNVTPVSTSWTTTGVNGDYIQVTQTYNFGNITINTNSFRFSMGYDVIDLRTGDIYYESTTDHMLPFNTVTKMPMAYISNTWNQYLKPIQTLLVTTNKFRSLSYWSINDILGNDFNPFTWLIDYVKMFRLYFDIDYVTKTITLKKGYFDTVTYKQAVVDYSKGVVIEPVIDKYNMVDFGYSHNDSVKGSLFKKSWGVEYGDLNISTGLDINNDKLSLNPNKDQSVFIPTILDTLYYNNLNSSSVIKTGNMLGTNKVINTLDKDGKIQYFPFFAFRLENKSDTFIYLSDDTPLQKSEGKYYYLEHRLLSNGWEDEEETIEDNTTVYYGKKLSSLPQFDNCISVNEGNVWKCTVCGYETEGSEAPSTCPNCGSALSFISLPKIILYWNTFNVPKEVFNGYLPYNLGSTAIYDQRWKNYLSEIFNVHNNKVTCYVKMTYPEFINFKFNQLFVIDNVTFLVNKIIDFNPNNPGPTKVELIEISNPNNLQ